MLSRTSLFALLGIGLLACGGDDPVVTPGTDAGGDGSAALAITPVNTVAIIDLAALAGALSPTLRQGDLITVMIEKTGEGKQQGVGHLDDGSLVVVSNAADAIGKRVDCTIIRLHATSNGRMVFAERSNVAKN